MPAPISWQLCVGFSLSARGTSCCLHVRVSVVLLLTNMGKFMTWDILFLFWLLGLQEISAGVIVKSDFI
jgi:hypothetical protein